jgi:hypothetical protein
MDFKWGWWTLVHASTTKESTWRFKWTWSCSAPSTYCNYAVNTNLVNNSTQVLFYTNSTLWSILNYSNSWKWALAMKDDAWRWWNDMNAWLTVVEQWSWITRDSAYWNRLWDTASGIIFCQSSGFWMLSIAYANRSNMWFPNAAWDWVNQNINIYIR